MKKRTLYSLVLAGILLSGCSLFDKKQQEGAIAEVNGHYLYRATIDSLTAGLNSDDSLRVAQQYISQWAKDMLIYDAVQQGHASMRSEEIEQMVADYRKTLYTLAYEEWLVDQNMSKTVLDTTVMQIYEQMPERFRLEESITQGMLLVVPNDAPNIQQLREWMNEGELDEIEKYAYQLANGYELFSDRWLTTTELISRMPMEREEMEQLLKAKSQIEVADSLNTYLVQITDKHLRGEAMPIEYARPEIEKIILSERQVEFLQNERERLYEEAVQGKKIKFF